MSCQTAAACALALGVRAEMRIDPRMQAVNMYSSIKLKFAHQGGINPPHVIMHGNMLDKLPQTYVRFLTNSIESEFKLVGTRVRLSFKNSDNPYDKKL